MIRKIFMIMAVALGVGLPKVAAQDVPVATLQHDAETTVYTGADAFKEAMAASAHGDVITLSSGIFNSPVITKAVSIFGAGSQVKTDSVDKPLTQLMGDIHIALDSINGKPAEGLYLEGILNNYEVWIDKPLHVSSFLKCRFNSFNLYNSDKEETNVNLLHLTQCRIAGWLEPGNAQSLSVYNSVINYVGKSTETSSLSFMNCVIINFGEKCKNATIKNSYIYSPSYNIDHSFHETDNNTNIQTLLDPTCSVFNCAYDHKATGNDIALNHVIVKDGNQYTSSTNIFTESNLYTNYSDTALYELTEEAKSSYKGTDGQPIGIYGGEYPYSTIPSVPYLTERNIAKKSENGKLKISVKVAVPGSEL